MIVGQVISFEDHLHDGAKAVGFCADRADFGFDVGEVTGEGFADIDHHIEFGGAVGASGGGFEAFYFGGVRTMRKADDCAYSHGGALEGEGGDGDSGRFYADAGDGVVVG